MFRFQAHGRFEIGHGGHRFTETGQHDAQVALRIRIIRVGEGNRLKMLSRISQIALLGINDPKISVSDAVGGIPFEHLGKLLDGFGAFPGEAQGDSIIGMCVDKIRVEVEANNIVLDRLFILALFSQRDPEVVVSFSKVRSDSNGLSVIGDDLFFLPEYKEHIANII